MSTDSWEHIESLYDDALNVPRGERAVFLREHCDDVQVQREVASLLSARKEASTFFDVALDQVVAPLLEEFERGRLSEEGIRRTPNLTGCRVGSYRFLEEVGVGGMSVVYRAERMKGDFEQTVAVKLLQYRLHPEGAEKRFRAERQVLANLDHPNIAQLIDGGLTEGGRPYLVMEHVDGVPITSYAEERGLDLEKRLDLLKQVFAAVQTAHRQLVVHRDLKPSNVLVTEAEGGPQVKLLDFGIAKLLGEALPVTRPETRTGQHLMTPAYAAPEQVSGEEITTTTDVYQLGVLGYELLSGTRPFELSGKSLTEIERIVLQKEPSPPSEAAQKGSIEPSKLRGDLDMILLTALRREPERRYRSVEALAADLARYQRGEPVAAQPTTVGYRAKKFVHRHRWGLGVTATFLIVVFLAGAILVRQRDRAQRNADRARQEAETADQVSSYLVDLFRATNPYEEIDTLTAQTLLQRGERRVSELGSQPAVQAQMLSAMGEAYRGMGKYDRADSLLDRAFSLRGPLYDRVHPAIAKDLHNLGRIREDQGRYVVAESLYTEALDIRRQLYDAPHREIAQTVHHLGSALRNQGELATADSLLEVALAMRRAVYEAPHPHIAETLNNLGLVRRERDHYKEADSLYREALAIKRRTLGSEHPSLATTLNNLALLTKERGKYEVADSLYREALAIKRRTLGSEHPSVATTLGNVAAVKEEMENFAVAESLYRETVAIETQRLRATHPRVLTTLDQLADVLAKRGKYDHADAVYRRLIALQRKRLGKHHLDVASSLNGLGIVLRKKGDLAAADSVYRKALAIKREQLGAQHSKVATTLNNRAIVLWEAERYADADSMYREALAIRKEHYGREHPRTATTMHNLAFTLKEQGKLAAADSLFRRALTIRRKALGERHLRVSDTHRGLGLLLRKRGRYQGAERHLQKALSIRRAKLRNGHPEVRDVIRPLAKLYDMWDQNERADQYRQLLAGDDGSEE